MDRVSPMSYRRMTYLRTRLLIQFDVTWVVVTTHVTVYSERSEFLYSSVRRISQTPYYDDITKFKLDVNGWTRVRLRVMLQWVFEYRPILTTSYSSRKVTGNHSRTFYRGIVRICIYNPHYKWYNCCLNLAKSINFFSLPMYLRLEGVKVSTELRTLEKQTLFWGFKNSIHFEKRNVYQGWLQYLRFSVSHTLSPYISHPLRLCSVRRLGPTSTDQGRRQRQRYLCR